MMPAATRLLLLRHGRSEWNAVRRWQGGFDSPLDHVGRRQAAAVAEELASLPMTWHGPFASTLSRAAETASIIADRLGLGAPSVDRRLAEAHAGEWEGLTPEEIEATYPGWLDQHRRPAGFEPFESVVQRATAALDDIARTPLPAHRTDAPDRDGRGHGSTAALVVSHSGLIRSVVRSLGLADTRIPNLGGVWLRASAGDRTRFEFDGVFDPVGITVSGVDAGGEDPGDQTDQADHHGGTDR
jgi:uncharacterized phosphatase